MRSAYEQLVYDAECIVNNVSQDFLEGNDMAYLAFMKGMGYLKVESFEGAGHNFYAVLDAIHNKYREDNKCRADEGVHTALLTLINIARNTEVFQMVTDYLFYQLDKEKDGTASFKMNTSEIIGKLKQCISERKDEILQKDPAFGPWLERANKVSTEDYGFSLIS